MQRKENGFKEITSSLCHMTEWPTRGKYGIKYYTVKYYNNDKITILYKILYYTNYYTKYKKTILYKIL